MSHKWQIFEAGTTNRLFHGSYINLKCYQCIIIVFPDALYAGWSNHLVRPVVIVMKASKGSIMS